MMMQQHAGGNTLRALRFWFNGLPPTGKLLVGGLGGLAAIVLAIAPQAGLTLSDLAAYWPHLSLAASVSSAGLLGGRLWWVQRQIAAQERQNDVLAQQGHVCLVLPPRGNRPETWRVLGQQAETFAAYTATMLRQFPGAHIALEIVGTEAGVVLQAWAPSDVYPTLEQLLLSSFPGAQLRQPKDVLKRLDVLAHLNARTAWSLLALERDAAHPLKQTGDFSDDALAAILASLSRAPGMGRVGLQLVLHAPSRRWSAHGQHEVQQLRQRLEQQRSALRAERSRQRIAAIERKADALTGVAATVRVFAEPQSLERLNRLRMAVFSVMRSPYNGLREVRSGYGPEPVLERRWDYRAGQRTVLSAEELAPLWHVPRTGDVLTARGVYLPPPPEVVTTRVPPFHPQHRILGKTVSATGETAYARWEHGFDTLVHSFFCGPTGVGKSTLIALLFIQDVCAGYGGILMEPHRDLTLNIIEAMPRDRLGDVIWINPTNHDRSFGVNLLDYGGDPTRREVATTTFINLLKKMLGTTFDGARMSRIASNAIDALTEAEATPTLQHVLSFLQSSGYRESVLGKVTNPVIRTYWEQEFGTWSASYQNSALGPVLNRVEPLLTRVTTRHVLTQPHTTLPFLQLMDAGKIVLIDLSAKDPRVGIGNAQALGTLMVEQIWNAAASRVKGSYRIPSYFWVDEFQEYVTDGFINILAEARGFGLGLNLATQYYERLPEEMRKAILSNCRTKITGAVESPDEARLLERIFEVPETQIRSLDAFTYLARVSAQRRSSDTFTLIGLPPLGRKPDQIDPDRLRRAFTQGTREKRPPTPVTHGGTTYDFFAGVPPLDAERPVWEHHQQALRGRSLPERAHYLAGLSEPEWEHYQRLRRQADLEEYQTLLSDSSQVPELPGFETLSPQARRVRRLSSLQVETPRDEIEAAWLRLERQPNAAGRPAAADFWS